MVTSTLSEVTLDISQVYEETFPAVASFVAKMGGSVDDARDIFHDAFVIAFEKESLDPAYIVGIAKHLWFRKFKVDKNLIDLDDTIEIPEDEKLPVSTRLVRLVETAGRACLDLLQSFYYEKRSAENIAESFNYSNAHSATVQKHKCLQKLRTFVKEKSLDYESFVE